MKQKGLQVITSLLLIITLTMANFLLLCVDVVSYAAGEISLEKSTNHKNVEFMAYFKDEKDNKITEVDTYTNSNDLKLYFQISVKQEGYFNGNIILNEANFKLKTDTLSDGISKIENNVIYLNQINAGESKEIEVGIELLKDEQFDLDLINMESKISIEGTYRDSTQKDISIKAEKNVTLNFVSPYTVPEESIVLSQEVITNKILKFNGEDKRVIQIQVNSGLKDNLFPISKSIINIQAPKISDKYPEQVLVNSNDIIVTNGKTLSQDNWNYNEETGLISINVENEKVDNRVSWIKKGEDKFIVTYIFDKDIQITDEKVNSNLRIELYDNVTALEISNEIVLDNNEKDNIITTGITQNETSIYKGKIYSGISRDITHTTVLSVNLTGVATEISLVEENDKINNTEIDTTYKYTKLNKNNIQNMLGEEGILSILNAETNEVISSITKDTIADNEGNIVISYPEGVSQIKINVTEPKAIGNINIESTKTIGKVSKNTAKLASEIASQVSSSYVSGSNINQLESVSSSIELKETETYAYLELNKSEISTMSSNSIEMRVTLESKNENNELYKNPTIRIQLPSKIETIDVTSINLVYEDELKITSAKLLDGNIIEIKLEGEQTKYKEDAIDGAIILINANITTSKKLPNSTENIVLTYTNENVVNYKGGLQIGQVETKINLVSYAGVVTINKVPDYGVEIINNEEEDKTVTLDMNSDKKVIKVENEIINNNENKITNVRILGTLPSKEAVQDVNNMDTSIQGEITSEGISEDRVKIYYSDNANATTDLQDEENGWTESISDAKNVKKYLAVIDELDVTEGANISYNTELPENLDYNLNAQQEYSVYYTNMTSEESVDVNPIKLSTPKGAVIDTELSGVIAGEQSNEVKENEVLRYVINVSNTGSEEISNIKVLAKVPEGTTFVNTEILNKETDSDDIAFEDENKKDVEFNIEKLAPGEKITKYYEVKVNEGMADKNITNTVTTQYGEVTKNSNEVSTTVKEGKVQLRLISVDAKEGIVNSGYSYRYLLYVTNTSDSDMKNIKVTINNNDTMDILEMYYSDSNNNTVIQKNTNSIEISKLSAGETVEISIYATVLKFKDATQKDVTLNAICVEDDDEYKSNEINNIAKSNLTLSMQVTSQNSGSYVKAGDSIKYEISIKNEGSENLSSITLNNWLPNDITLTKVIRNGVELSSEQYSLKVDSDKNKKLLAIEENIITSGETIKYEIEAVANLVYGSTNAIELVNEYSLKSGSFEVETAKITHILQPYQDSTDEGNNNEGNPGEGNSGSNVDETNKYRIISGSAWIDENENGQKDSNEKTVEGITVKLLDVQKNDFVKDSDGNVLTTVTSSTGFYSFSKVEKGQYLVIFEYDTTQYGLTSFEKEGVPSEVNSNVITKTININGEESKIAATEIVNIENENISNINIGLITAKKYDLQLEKFISKVTVQNNKTVTNNYDDVTLVKEEIDAKQVNSTMVVVEYTIRITNKGDVAGYVKKIADYLSVDYKFNSELNKDWYQSGNEVYCTSLANEKIEPGQSKEVTLTVIKEMTENNTGLVNNTAEIVSSYNELGLTDINSTEGNKVKGENDMGSADLIISIKTGQVVMTVSLIISTIVILGIAIFLIRKIIINKNII